MSEITDQEQPIGRAAADSFGYCAAHAVCLDSTPKRRRVDAQLIQPVVAYTLKSLLDLVGGVVEIPHSLAERFQSVDLIVLPGKVRHVRS